MAFVAYKKNCRFNEVGVRCIVVDFNDAICKL